MLPVPNMLSSWNKVIIINSYLVTFGAYGLFILRVVKIAI